MQSTDDFLCDHSLRHFGDKISWKLILLNFKTMGRKTKLNAFIATLYEWICLASSYYASNLQINSTKFVIVTFYSYLGYDFLFQQQSFLSLFLSFAMTIFIILSFYTSFFGYRNKSKLLYLFLITWKSNVEYAPLACSTSIVLTIQEISWGLLNLSGCSRTPMNSLFKHTRRQGPKMPEVLGTHLGALALVKRGSLEY